MQTWERAHFAYSVFPFIKKKKKTKKKTSRHNAQFKWSIECFAGLWNSKEREDEKPNHNLMLIWPYTIHLSLHENDMILGQKLHDLLSSHHRSNREHIRTSSNIQMIKSSKSDLWLPCLQYLTDYKILTEDKGQSDDTHYDVQSASEAELGKCLITLLNQREIVFLMIFLYSTWRGIIMLV